MTWHVESQSKYEPCNKSMKDSLTVAALAVAMISLLLVVLMGAALFGGWKPMVTADKDAVEAAEAQQAISEATLAAARQAAWDAAWARRLATRPVYYNWRPYHHWRPPGHHRGHHGDGISITNTVGNLTSNVDTPEPVAEEPAV